MCAAARITLAAIVFYCVICSILIFPFSTSYPSIAFFINNAEYSDIDNCLVADTTLNLATVSSVTYAVILFLSVAIITSVKLALTK